MSPEPSSTNSHKGTSEQQGWKDFLWSLLILALSIFTFLGLVIFIG